MTIKAIAFAQGFHCGSRVRPGVVFDYKPARYQPDGTPVFPLWARPYSEEAMAEYEALKAQEQERMVQGAREACGKGAKFVRTENFGPLGSQR